MFKVIEGGVTAPRGFMSSGVCCGIKKRGKDLALIYSEAACNVAGVFTTNRVKAAPVLVTKERVSKGKARAVIVNSGSANCCTGSRGERDARKMAEITASGLGIAPGMVLVCSTGGIGRYLPMEKIVRGIPNAVRSLSPGGSIDAEEAILTTDLVTKSIAVEFKVGGEKVFMGGIAKGSGMIRPSMATMLAFITTDAAVSRPFMRRALKAAVDVSFNRITVDGDMSTNDTALLLANGAAGNARIAGGKHGKIFQDALTYVCKDLARKIVRDGEGATKFVTVRVEAAASEKAAVTAARAVAESPLVKTAIFGEDPNWGRIMSSIGASGVKFDCDNTAVSINGVSLVKSGARTKYDERKARAAMKKKEIIICVNLSSGKAVGEVWTCDFSHGYVEINI